MRWGYRATSSPFAKPRSYRARPLGRRSGRMLDLRSRHSAMTPSTTVENYLKAIYHAQSELGPDQHHVPMGRLAAALGVVPGTATTMVKTLAESGLVTYEPYIGARLSPAGEKLAAMVLRRHR